MLDMLGEPATMKALSLWQPWASLMAAGVKLHETRHWSTSHRGQTAIHAAKTRDLAGSPDQLCAAALGPYWPRDLVLGAVVGIGNLAQVRRAETVCDHLTRADLAAGNYAQGRFAWRFESFRALARPIPAIGRQGLWNWTPPADLESQLGPVLDHAAACRRIGWA